MLTRLSGTRGALAVAGPKRGSASWARSGAGRRLIRGGEVPGASPGRHAGAGWFAGGVGRVCGHRERRQRGATRRGGVAAGRLGRRFRGRPAAGPGVLLVRLRVRRGGGAGGAEHRVNRQRRGKVLVEGASPALGRRKRRRADAGGRPGPDRPVHAGEGGGQEAEAGVLLGAGERKEAAPAAGRPGGQGRRSAPRWSSSSTASTVCRPAARSPGAVRQLAGV
mmetsp:Transcript_25019/g.64473  ORF Transcript_25019/g.64473 Transcript_25019/m.64473 type:complete len:222 (+) Transcript_25019:1873-2538(+)